MTLQRNKIEYKINFKKPVEDVIKNLPEIDGANIKIYYENDTYDGPEEGVCIWNDKKHYFKVFRSFEDFKSSSKKSYFLIDLGEEILEEDEKRHKELLEYKNIDEYYNIINKYTDKVVEQDKIIAWFEK